MKADFHVFDELLKIESPEALLQALKKIIASLSFEKFAYYSEVKNSRNEVPVILTNYPDDWIAHYVANDYGDIDPVHIAAKKSVLPIQWGGDEYIKRLSRQQRKLFNEAAGYGISLGFTMPIHSSGRFAALTVASAENNSAFFQKRTQKNKSFLHLLALHFDEAIQNTNQPTNQPTC